MVTILIKKTSDFDNRPEFDIPRQAFNSLKDLIANSPDTPASNYLSGHFRGSYLNSTAAVLKANNLSVRKFEETQKGDEGNLILETKVQVHPNILMIYINLTEIGILEGRGSFDIKPAQNGFWLHAQEFDYYKNSPNEEAHAMKRTVSRNYTINGQYDWQNLHRSLMPEGTLQIAVNQQRHPGILSFPLINQGPVYSSLSGNPGFPPLDLSQTFAKFGNFGQSSCPPQPSANSRCCQCGGVKSVGVQTGSSLCAISSSMGSYPSVQTQTSTQQTPSTSTTQSLQSFGSSWFLCTCDSMDCH